MACITTPKLAGAMTPHRMKASAIAAETQNTTPILDL